MAEADATRALRYQDASTRARLPVSWLVRLLYADGHEYGASSGAGKGLGIGGAITPDSSALKTASLLKQCTTTAMRKASASVTTTAPKAQVGKSIVANDEDE
ncbi:hypothetical protein HETIRDRAFT_119211 [Heterobasidion irregulare TC 32-1]|uniref:Uncharacterized protein n=1 Tax=Heterobasidion irregulare (strain TC 32-1) TaxID=747525 RepID=W4JQU1_HETIT|nr:uncharacterized protein HETIRDRAFT_119211 [Heterobasidion irregulare TC 32-1]ETW75903.1 hypothetical protein HETIRDRAFT_119211 [Heterobasidion irregulare TC 32-1]